MWRVVVVLVSLLSTAAPAPADDTPAHGFATVTLLPLDDDPTATQSGVLVYTPLPPIRIDSSTPRMIGGLYNPATGIVGGSDTVTLSDNTIVASGKGIEFSASKAGTITHNQVTGAGTAILVHASTLDITANVFSDNSVGIWLSSSTAATRIDGNHIAGNGVGLRGSAADASGDWWGAADGAGGDGGGSGDPAIATGGAVVLSPALTTPPSGAGPRP